MLQYLMIAEAYVLQYSCNMCKLSYQIITIEYKILSLRTKSKTLNLSPLEYIHIILA